MNVKPLGDRVIIQPSEGLEKTKGGILIPDTAKEKPQEGKIVAIGTGKKTDDGKLNAVTVHFGVRSGGKQKKGSANN